MGRQWAETMLSMYNDLHAAADSPCVEYRQAGRELQDKSADFLASNNVEKVCSSMPIP